MPEEDAIDEVADEIPEEVGHVDGHEDDEEYRGGEQYKGEEHYKGDEARRTTTTSSATRPPPPSARHSVASLGPLRQHGLSRQRTIVTTSRRTAHAAPAHAAPRTPHHARPTAHACPSDPPAANRGVRPARRRGLRGGPGHGRRRRRCGGGGHGAVPSRLPGRVAHLHDHRAISCVPLLLQAAHPGRVRPLRLECDARRNSRGVRTAV